MDEVLREEWRKTINEVGRNIPGGNFLSKNSPVGIFKGEEQFDEWEFSWWEFSPGGFHYNFLYAHILFSVFLFLKEVFLKKIFVIEIILCTKKLFESQKIFSGKEKSFLTSKREIHVD